MTLLNEKQIKEMYFQNIGGFPPNKHVKEVKDYKGEEYCCIACTQFDYLYSERNAKSILNEWIDFLRTNTKTFKALPFNDGYWNEVRLQSDFANWDIYISFDEDTITGGMFATGYPDGILEIFGLEAIDEICYRRLIEFAITNLRIRHMNASELVFLAPVDNKVLIMAARQVGFSITNTYRCWEKSLSGCELHSK